MPEKLGFESHEQWAKAIAPMVKSALANEREVPAQPPFSEAWLAYALYCYDRLLPLQDVIESADAINHGIPNQDQVAWAFVSLRKRSWLIVEGDKYGLTPEGRRAVNTIVVQGSLERLRNWISTHAPSGNVLARDVFLSLGRKE